MLDSIQILAAAQDHLAVAGQFILAQQEDGGPKGPEFGKASPIGLLVIVALAVVVLRIGWGFYRRYSRMARRQAFAEEHDLDVFDVEAVDKAMSEAGVQDKRRLPWL